MGYTPERHNLTLASRFVTECDTTACPLHLYRKGKNPLLVGKRKNNLPSRQP